MPSISSRCIQGTHHVHHLFRGDGVRRRDQVAIDAQFGAGLHFAAHVDLRSGHVAHQHRRQSRPDAPRRQRRTSSATSCLIAAAIAAPSRTLGIMISKLPSYRLGRQRVPRAGAKYRFLFTSSVDSQSMLGHASPLFALCLFRFGYDFRAWRHTSSQADQRSLAIGSAGFIARPGRLGEGNGAARRPLAISSRR